MHAVNFFLARRAAAGYCLGMKTTRNECSGQTTVGFDNIVGCLVAHNFAGDARAAQIDLSILLGTATRDSIGTTESHCHVVSDFARIEPGGEFGTMAAVCSDRCRGCGGLGTVSVYDRYFDVWWSNPCTACVQGRLMEDFEERGTCLDDEPFEFPQA